MNVNGKKVKAYTKDELKREVGYGVGSLVALFLIFGLPFILHAIFPNIPL